MKILWLTFHDPVPAISGQYLYSSGLISAVGRAGVAVDVAALARPDGRHFNEQREGTITWHLAAGGEWQSSERLLSRLPRITLRCATSNMRSSVESLLKANRYDAIVFDSICVGWALSLKTLREAARNAVLVHIAHNHERTAAERMAERESRFFRKLIRQDEARKIDALERRLIAQSHFSTSNTPEDLATFESENPGKRFLLLPPGYSGRRVASRRIDPNVPRRAILVGSFNWEPKRTSLEAFLDVAAPLFSSSRIEFQVVGSAEESYLDWLRSRFPSVVFTGRVPEIFDRLAKARIAVVPDYLGGFKLKSLDYAFNRIPIFALQGSVPGVPLEEGRSVRLFSDYLSLAQGIVDQIDSFDLLNTLQVAAYRDFAPLFDWARIGEDLVENIERERKGMGDVTRAFDRTGIASDALAAS